MNFNLTQERLKELLSYNPENGEFYWIGHSSNRTRGAYAKGLQAGRIHKVRGYREIGIGGYRFQAHRLAWLYMKGELPDSIIDHVNHDRADNKWSNLRLSNHSDNGKNRKGPTRLNKLGIRGVHQIKTGFRARIVEGGKSIHLGVFATAEEAAIAFSEAEKKYRSHIIGDRL